MVLVQEINDKMKRHLIENSAVFRLISLIFL